MERPVTQKDIARTLGISSLTVHRALSGSGYVSAELRDRIVVCARKLEYRPNRNAKALFRPQRYFVALFSGHEPSFFWQDVATGVRIASKQVTDYGIHVEYTRVPFADTESYLRRLARAESSGVDAVALVNGVEYDMERIFSFLSERKIPYITMNVDAPETERMCFVGPDYGEGGRIAAELMNKMLRGTCHVTAILHRFPEHTHLASARTSKTMLDSFSGRLRASPDARFLLDIKTIDYGISDQRTTTILREYLHVHASRLRGIYCIGSMNDLLGRVIRELGLANRIKVITHDLTAETEKFLEEAVFTAVLYQNPIMQGYYAVKILENFLETGRRPEKDLLLVHDIVVKENIGINRNYESQIGMQY